MSRDSETFRLLQPGLLSFEELKEIFSQRGIHLKPSESKTKLQLVELYEKMLLPLSQRKFPNTHLGQIVNKKIAEEDRKRSKNEPKPFEFQYGFKEISSGRSLTSGSKGHGSSQSTSNSHRLKPPIETSNIPKKKICLSRVSSSDKSLDKIVIKDRSKSSEDSHKEKSDKKPSKDKKNIQKSDNKPTAVNNPCKESKKEDKDEPKEKRRRIAWPIQDIVSNEPSLSAPTGFTSES